MTMKKGDIIDILNNDPINGESEDKGTIIKIISPTELHVTLISDPSITCLVKKEDWGWEIIENIEERMEISTDHHMSKGLKDEIQPLRGGMVGAANQQELPERFLVQPHPDEPSMVFTDKETGKMTVIGLCDYRGVRKALNDLFGSPL